MTKVEQKMRNSRTAAVLDRVNTTMQCGKAQPSAVSSAIVIPMIRFGRRSSTLMARTSTIPAMRIPKENIRTSGNMRQRNRNNCRRLLRGSKSRESDPSITTGKMVYAPQGPDSSRFCQFVNGELIDTKWLGIRRRKPVANIDLTEKRYLIINYRTRTPGGWMEIRLDDLHGPPLQRTGLIPSSRGEGRFTIPIKATSKVSTTSSLSFIMVG